MELRQPRYSVLQAWVRSTSSLLGSRPAASHFQSHASPEFEVQNLNLGWSRGFAWAASCINHYNEEVSIDVSKELSETSGGHPGTRTFANHLSSRSVTVKPRGCRGGEKEKRKEKKISGCTQMERERLNCKSADMNLWDTCSPVAIVAVKCESGRLFFNGLWE